DATGCLHHRSRSLRFARFRSSRLRLPLKTVHRRPLQASSPPHPRISLPVRRAARFPSNRNAASAAKAACLSRSHSRRNRFPRFLRPHFGNSLDRGRRQLRSSPLWCADSHTSQYPRKSPKLSRPQALRPHQPLFSRSPRFHSRASPLVSWRIQSHPQKQNRTPMDSALCQPAPRDSAHRLNLELPVRPRFRPVHPEFIAQRLLLCLPLISCEITRAPSFNVSPYSLLFSQYSVCSFRPRALSPSPRPPRIGLPTAATPAARASPPRHKSTKPT